MKIKSLNKFFACFMATLVLLTSFSVSFATAETEGFFQYEIVNEYDTDFEDGIADTYAVITKYTGSESAVSVPSSLGGYPVKVIEFEAFKDNSAVKTVTVPETVESIGDNAFENCVNLTVLNLPANLTNIGSDIVCGTPIFEDSKYWEGDLLYIGTYLLAYDDSSENTEIIIKDGTTLIAAFTFSFTDIQSVKLPESLKVIGSMAFSYCENLKSIIFPQNLETIGFWAFENCTGITEIEIPASVKNLGESAFYGAKNLSKATLPDNIEVIPMGIFEDCTNLKNVQIPSTVKSINDFAFYNTGLETVTIPKNVEFVASDAFVSCKNLTAINVEKENALYFSIDGVLYEDFGYGIYLTTYPAGKAGESFTLPENVNSLSLNAFNGVKNLKTVVLNDNVSDVSLYYSDSLEKIKVPETNQNLYDIDGVVFDLNNTLVYYPDGKKDSKYTVPQNTSKIKESAFVNNQYLEELTISEGSHTTLCFFSVFDCDNLRVINLPSTVKMENPTSIGGCDQLNTINFNGTKAQWNALNCQPYSNSTKGLYLYTTDGTFELFAPYEEEPDFTLPTEPSQPEYTEPAETTTATEPSESAPAETTATTPAESTTTEPSENTTATLPEVEFEIGDVNKDSKLNIRDATAIQKHLAKISTLSDDAVLLADYTKDGKVNIKDATTIQKKIAGLI